MGLRDVLKSPTSKSKSSFKLSSSKYRSNQKSPLLSPTKMHNVDEIFIDLTLTKSVVAKEMILEKSPLGKYQQKK